MKVELGMSRLKNWIVLGIVAVVAVGIFLHWASPVLAQSAAPSRPDAPTVRALHLGMVEIDWLDVPGAQEYEVQFWSTDGWIDIPDADLGIEAFFYGARVVATGLPRAYSYDAFQVRAGNNQGWSGWSDYGWIPTTHNMDWEGIPVPEIEPPLANTPATGAPEISGTAQVGQTLTADTSGIADSDGLNNIPYSYQWVRVDDGTDADITGATNSTYVLVSADEDKTIKVKVSFTDEQGNAESLTSDATATVAARPNTVATGKPTIRGTAQVCETLTVDTSGITDSDGLNDISYSYQWVRSDHSTYTDISDAIGSTYTLVSADEGKTIKVKVSFTDDLGNAETLTSAATVSVARKPNTPATGAPTITGTARVGQTLTVDTSSINDADGLTNVTYTYYWFRSGQNTTIRYSSGSGPNFSRFQLKEADEGKTIEVTVYFTDDAGKRERLFSEETSVVQANHTDAGNTMETATDRRQGLEDWETEYGLFDSIDPADDVDYFRIEVPHEGYYWIDFLEFASEQSYLPYSHVTVLDSTGDCVLQDCGGGETNVSPIRLEAGIFFIKVAAIPDSGQPGPTEVRRPYAISWDTFEWSDEVQRCMGLQTEVADPLYGCQSHLYNREYPGEDINVEPAWDAGALGEGVNVVVVDLGVNPHHEDLEGVVDIDRSGEESIPEWWQDSFPNGPPSQHGTMMAGVIAAQHNELGVRGIAPGSKIIPYRMRIWGSRQNDAMSHEHENVAVSNNSWGSPSGSYFAGGRHLIEVGIAQGIANGFGGKGTSYVFPASQGFNVNLDTIQNFYPVTTVCAVDPQGRASSMGSALHSGGYGASLWVCAPVLAYSTKSYYEYVSEVGTSISTAIVSGVTALVRGWNPELTWRDAKLILAESARQNHPEDPEWRTGAAKYGVEDESYRYNPNYGFGVVDAGRAVELAKEWVNLPEMLTYSVTGAGIDLPDNSGGIITTSESTVDVRDNDGGVPTFIEHVEVVLSFEHRYPQELDVELVSPSGNTAHLLWPMPDDKNVYVPDMDVSLGATMFLGENPEGQWRLRIRDELEGNSGELASWKLVIRGHREASALPPAQNAPATGGPTINGTAEVGETLTAGTSGIADADGLTNVSYGYQWLADDADISGAIEDTYVLTTSEMGKAIKVKVSFTDNQGNAETLTSASTASVAAKPNTAATGAPTISGTAEVGQTLTADTSGIADADGLAGVSFNYQWLADDADIASATASTYLLTTSEMGKAIKVRVSFTDEGGNDEVLTSAATGAVSPAIQQQTSDSPATGLPTISGTPQVGETLTANTSGITDADGLDDVSYGYQWVRNDGTDDEDITGATSSTYTLVDADENKTIKVKASFTDDADNEETLTSAATTTVRLQNTPATGAPNFYGTTRVDRQEIFIRYWSGNTILRLGEIHTVSLTAHTAEIADEDSLTNATFSYQWIADGIDILDADSSRYTLSDEDVGKTIKLRVSFTDDAGHQETLTSTKSATVQAHTNSEPIGLPSISGTALVGETLTVRTRGISDEDGLTSPSYSFQWTSDDADIEGATGRSYIVASRDVGHAIKVRVSFADDLGYPATLTSTAITAQANSADESNSVSYITVSATRDDSDPNNVLTNFTVTWNEANDCSSDYNAYLVAVLSSGNTKTHLGSVASDGTQITKGLPDSQESVPGYKVDLYCGTDTEHRLVSSVAIPSNDARKAARPGTYSSELPLTGLSASHGTLTPAFNANTRQYTLPDVASENSRITIFATTKSGYAVDFNEGADGPVMAVLVQPGSCSEVSVSHGADITLDDLTDAHPNAAGFQVDLNKGKNHIIARVYFTGGCDVGTLYSLTVTRDGRPNETATGTPAISGTPQVGQTLTASTSSVADTDGLDNAKFKYQWIADDTDIGGAKSATYVVTYGDIGKTIKVRVSFTDDADSKESLTSAATSAVTDPASRAYKYQVQSSSISVSYITVSVTQDASDLNNVVSDFTVTWNDTEDCSSGYNAYLLVSLPSGDTTTHLGSAASNGTQIAKAQSGVQGSETGFDVELYCGTDASGRLVSRVAIPSDYAGEPNSGIYSSEPPLTALGVSQGTLTPAFNSHTLRYTVPDAGSTADQITITAPARSGYNVDFDEGTDENSFGSLLVTYPGGVPLCGDVGFGSESGELDNLTDADPDTPGFQVDLYEGRNHIFISTVRASTCDITSVYRVTITSSNQRQQANRPATGKPTISGEARTGMTLTAETSEIRDSDGLGTFSYWWLADDNGITGATGKTYVLTANDLGKSIKVRVSFSDDRGNRERLTSEATTAVARPNNASTGWPVVTGTREVGQTLQVDVSGIRDEDGLNNADFQYQWIRYDGTRWQQNVYSGTLILGATESSYTLVDADMGHIVDVRVTFADDLGNLQTVHSLEDELISKSQDVNSVASGTPTISGTAQVGETLTADTSSIADTDGLSNASYSYQWIRNHGTDDEDVSGATKSTYTLVSDDQGKTIKVKVSFTDDAGNQETLTSAATAAVSKKPNSAATGATSISGTAEVGQPVTADTSGIADADGLNGVSFSYQWLADDADIAGATASTYLLTTSEMDKAIKVRVSFTDDRGNEEVLTSEATGAVSPAIQQQTSNSPATGLPTISGTLQVGQTLTADTSGITDADGLDNVSFSYQWVRSDGTTDTDITGATGSTYTLVSADQGKTVKVRVSFTDDAGNSETLTSASTASVAAVSVDPPSRPTGLAALATSNSVTLTWDDPGDDSITGYQVLRLNRAIHSLGDFQIHVDDTGSNETTYTYTDVEAEARYVYRIKARNSAGLSPRSRFANADLPEAPPEVVNSPATGSPTISGTAQVGEALTADTSGITDADGLDNVSFSYQWVRSDGTTDTDITGATGSTYTLVSADQGNTVKVGVSFTDDAGNAETLTSASTASVAASPNTPASGTPTISGTAQVGEALTADTSGITDADGLDNVSFSYQWVRSDGTTDTDITGATGSTYTLVSADQGNTVKVGVSFTDDAGNAETLTSASTASVAASPNTPASGTPTISGTAQVGEALTADTSGITDADGLDNVSFSYQWVRSDGTTDTDITGATGSTYTLVSADQGNTVKVGVSFTDDAGNAGTLTSASTASVAASPNTPASGTPTISGTAQVGEALTADTSGITDADGLDNVSFSYQWVRSDGTTDTDITGATGSTYTLVSADQGNTVKVGVSFTDDAGNAETLTSASTASVAASPNTPASGTPTISGTAQVGEALTADTSGITDADGLDNVSFSYQWVRSDGTTDTDITGATGSTYTLVSADQGNTVKVGVSFTDDAGNAETLTSASTASVAASPNTPASGTPTISGTAQVGEALTADTSGITDADGLDNVSFSYQWVRSDGTTDTDITGATGSTYTLVSEDQGNTVKVRVSFTDDAGNAETLTSASTASVAASPNTPASGTPTISGTAQVGEALTADTSGITDADGLDNVSVSYQWVRSDGTTDTDITGATGSTYTLVSEDQGNTVKVRVSFTDDAGNAETLTSASTASVAASPNTPASGTPTISGTAQVGEALTADTSGITDADGLDNVSFSYQWVRSDGTTDTDITGATGSTYTLVSEDQGNTVKVRVSFTDDAGNAETLTSASTVSVEAATGDRPIWAATMTTAQSYTGQGYSGFDGFRVGSLTETSFEIDNVTYTVNLVEAAGWVYIGFDRELPIDFTLEVDGTRFQSSDASFTSYTYSKIYKWEDAEIHWSEGDSVQLRLYPSSSDLD